jgi:ADP-heptose:LPS heptosyltransferase
LRRAGFDAALVTSAIRYWLDLKLALRLGIPNRAGFTHKGFKGWVTHPVPIDWPKPYPHLMMQLVNHLVGRTDIPSSLRPVIYPSPDDVTQATDFLARRQLGPQARWVAMFPTTRQRAARWDDGRFADLCDRLASASVRCVLLGGPGDRDALHAVASLTTMPPPPICAGELGLRALCVALARCPAVLCTDSGPRHIANASGAPVFFLRNLRSFQIETGPYCNTETDLVPDGELLTPDAQARLLDTVPVEEVAGRLLARMPRGSGLGVT